MKHCIAGLVGGLGVVILFLILFICIIRKSKCSDETKRRDKKAKRNVPLESHSTIKTVLE